MNAIPTGVKILISDQTCLKEIIAALKAKGVEVAPVEESPDQLNFDNLVPECAPWNSEGFEKQSGKKKAQWKSEMNERRFK